MQHQLAITLSSVTLFLDLLCPLFCASRVLKDGPHLRRVREQLFRIIDAELDTAQALEATARTYMDGEYTTGGDMHRLYQEG